MGATNWAHVDQTPLHGADVVVVPDQDEPGYRYARAVIDSLRDKAQSTRVMRAKVGKDAADHVAAGYGLDDLVPCELPESEPTPAVATANGAGEPGGRVVHLTRASTIRPRPVKWLWDGWIPLGSVTLCGGREGVGKTSAAYTIAAAVTRGTLPGARCGTPKAVIVAATEDSWAHTIVPRLMAVGADLNLVYRVDVTSDDVETALSLPVDLPALERHVRDRDVALVLLDPLLSRLDPKLDTHVDAEVRLALEPLAKFAAQAERRNPRCHPCHQVADH